VWDPLVRIGHWLVVLGFFAAYLTEDDLLDVHVWAGYVVGAVVVVRVAWGFVGPQHARFADFVHGPGEIFRYVRGLITLQGKRYIGHSPAGGAMVIALLLSLAATTGSGLALYAIEENAGPLASWMGQAGPAPNVDAIPSADTRAASENDESERGAKGSEAPGEEFWEELHEFFANFTLALVVFHIAGVLLASYAHRENLVRAMITGKKRAE
jgi:cytochrome b